MGIHTGFGLCVLGGRHHLADVHDHVWATDVSETKDTMNILNPNFGVPMSFHYENLPYSWIFSGHWMNHRSRGCNKHKPPNLWNPPKEDENE